MCLYCKLAGLLVGIYSREILTPEERLKKKIFGVVIFTLAKKKERKKAMQMPIKISTDKYIVM